jgi:hypothetical protein
MTVTPIDPACPNRTRRGPFPHDTRGAVER